MTEPLAKLDVDDFGPGDIAILLDFDGTLVEIADHPDSVALLPDTQAVLATLTRVLDGALAVVTGRAIGDVDRFLEPLRLPVAGVHGLERRGASGAVHVSEIDAGAIAAVREALQRLVGEEPGLLLETKPGSVAMHYRARPELKQRCIEAVHRSVSGIDGLNLLHGKMVIEAKSGADTKADALAGFMAEPPFLGRLPIFAGDDITDESAFRAIGEHDGVSIKIGNGDTAARYRASDTDEFLGWLTTLAGRLERKAGREKPGFSSP